MIKYIFDKIIKKFSFFQKIIIIIYSIFIKLLKLIDFFKMQISTLIIATVISSVTCGEYPTKPVPMPKPLPDCALMVDGVCCPANKYWDGKCRGTAPPPYYPMPQPPIQPVPSPNPNSPSCNPALPENPSYEFCKKHGLLDLDLNLSLRKLLDLNLDLNLDLARKCILLGDGGLNLDLDLDLGKSKGGLLDLDLDLGKTKGGLLDLNLDLDLNLGKKHNDNLVDDILDNLLDRQCCKKNGLIDLNVDVTLRRLIDLNVDLNLLNSCRKHKDGLLNLDLDLNLGKGKGKGKPNYEWCRRNHLLDFDLDLTLNDLLNLNIDLSLISQCRHFKNNKLNLINADINLDLGRNNQEHTKENPIHVEPVNQDSNTVRILPIES